MYLNNAVGYIKIGEYDSARISYQNALNYFDKSIKSSKYDELTNENSKFLSWEAKIELAQIKVLEKKYDESISDLNVCLQHFESEGDTLNSLSIKTKLLVPLRQLNKIDELIPLVSKIDSYIAQSKLSNKLYMKYYWALFIALRNTKYEESNKYKHLAIENMNKFLDTFQKNKDKDLIKLNHSTVKEILEYQNN
jgi:tetratricopeptide (TPR) repeat protein